MRWSLASQMPIFRVCLGMLLSSFCAIIAGATSLMPVRELVHVKTFASPSGRFQLEVDPTHRYGAGPGHCTLTEGSRTLVFDLSGTRIRTLEIDKSWGDRKSPNSIAVNSAGEMFLGDFEGRSPFARLTATGALVDQFQPHFSDGRHTKMGTELRVAPDGRLWFNNRYSLVRLNNKGLVTAVIGQPPGSTALGIIDSAACDTAGNLCAVDSQTGLIHVFDATGRHRRVLRPDKEERLHAAGHSPPVLADDGRIFYDTGRSTARYLLLGSNGKRLSHRLTPELMGRWKFRQGTGGFAAVNRDWDQTEIILTDNKGTVQKVITRRPDRRWLENAGSIQIAADGSFAVVAKGKDSRDGISFYGPRGEPQRTIDCPVEDGVRLLGWTGQHLLLSTYDETLLCDRDGKPLRRLPGGFGNHDDRFLTCGGREWWVLEFTTRRVTRFAVP